jgi:hypothetical protein
MAKFDNHMIFRVVLIVLAALVLFFLIQYYTSKQTQQRVATERYANNRRYHENFEDSVPAPVPVASAPHNPLMIDDTEESKKETDDVRPAEETDNGDYRSVDYSPNKVPSDCFPSDRLTAEDLLPGDTAANSKWAQVNPAGQGDVSNQNFLTAGWAVGINTVSGSLRNANLQLRSEPPNPRSAWPIMNSTIQPDILRKPLEIGGDC